MFKNYFKTAVQALFSQKLFALINLAGLSVGLACFILITILVRYETSYEDFFANSERIYRIGEEIHPQDGSPEISMATNAPQVAPLLKEEFAQVEAAGRMYSWTASTVPEEGEESLADTMLVDPEIFDIFNFEWLQGSPEQALREPATVVLTQSTASRYFGTADPLGKNLMLDNSFPLRVVGVIRDLPGNTHLHFDQLAPLGMITEVLNPYALLNWSGQYFHTYVRLAEGADMQELQAQFPGFIDRHIEEGASSFFSFSAMPLADIHLDSNRRYELSPPGNRSSVNAFIVVAVMVLLVACMNFMNLSTVKAVRRAREVGVRKAIGARKSQLLLQFLGEALLLTALAVLCALVLVELSLPTFAVFVQRELSFTLLDSAATIPLLFALTLFVSLVSSGYPSFYLSAFNPALVLKGDVSRGSGAALFRSALVVLQFSVAVVLLIATFTIYRQLAYLQSHDPGYEREQIVVLNNLGREGVGRQWELLKNELLAIPAVYSVTASNTLPTQSVGSSYYIDYEGGLERRSMPLMLVDYDFFETYGIGLSSGRVFSKDYSQDRRLPESAGSAQASGTFVINELAAAQLGWTPETALGKWLEVSCCGFGQGVVAGVVSDAHFGSLRFAAAPLIYAIPPEPGATLSRETRLGLAQISVRISGQQVDDTLARIDAAWHELRPDQSLSRHFLEEDFRSLYQDEERQGLMMTSFALVAVLITCLGLFGLSTYNAQRRTKEIGVRKVMGGSVWNIVLLLTNDFSKLVLLANIIAWPLAWVAMEGWLENFAYRIDLTPLIFIGSALLALCVAWVTVGSTAAKAANQKPVLALRYE